MPGPEGHIDKWKSIWLLESRLCKHVQESLPLKIIFTSGDQGDLHIISSAPESDHRKITCLPCSSIVKMLYHFSINRISTSQHHLDIAKSIESLNVLSSTSSSQDHIIIGCNFHPSAQVSWHVNFIKIRKKRGAKARQFTGAQAMLMPHHAHTWPSASNQIKIRSRCSLTYMSHHKCCITKPSERL